MYYVGGGNGTVIEIIHATTRYGYVAMTKKTKSRGKNLFFCVVRVGGGPPRHLGRQMKYKDLSVLGQGFLFPLLE